jgi:hypothetical protein
MSDAPLFRHPSPDPSLLRELIEGYEHLTGDAVNHPRKRNFIAACYRVHGAAFLPLVMRLFESTGTAINLLGQIRLLAPQDRPATDAHVVEPEPTEPQTRAAAGPVTDPAASAARPGPVAHGSGRRDSRGPANPDTPTLFSEAEFEDSAAPPRRGP